MTLDSNIGRQTGRRQKAAKGTIKVEADKGWLRLRFTYQGKRKALVQEGGNTPTVLQAESLAEQSR